MAIYSGDDSRRLIPLTIVQVLTTLIDDLEPERPSPTWAELRAIRSRMCRVFRIEDPALAMSATAAAQAVAELDGDEVDDGV